MGKALPGDNLFRQCSHKKPLKEEKMATGSLFVAVGSGFDKNRNQTPSEKGLFAEGIPLELLVRFLWAHKENEQVHRR